MKSKPSPLTYPAAGLSLASLAWTTWSLVDLLGTGLIGVTVAAGADVIWGSVILAEARGLRIGGRRWLVPAIGWAALVAVAVFLVWHGIDKNVPAMAVAGPLLPLGAKVVWALALADMRDPAALTDDERAVLARMERGMAFEEAQHGIEMRRRAMAAELQLAELSTDFSIELTRQDKTRELTRRRPLELPAAIRPANTEQDREQLPNVVPSTVREQIAEQAVTSTNPDRERPNIAAVVREQIATTASNTEAVRRVMAIIPDANEDSVAAAVRRARRKSQMKDGYA